MEHDKNFCHLGLAVIETEASAISSLSNRINDNFATACQHIIDCKGRIVVLGMGKSGHIAGKIAATLASTGSPAFFVHPGEASHGDMGMIISKDVVLAISNSGETDEIRTILPLIKRLGVPFITMTGNPNSTLAKAATVNIDVSVDAEACPLGLAPTSSTTAALVMGDALAIAVLDARGFTTEDFARSHPGGPLGRRLLLLIDDVMHTELQIPQVSEQATLSEALYEVTKKKLGMTTVIGSQGELLGVFTDGDLRRALDQNVDIRTTPIKDVMNTHCKTVNTGILAAEALQVMEAYKISSLVVVNDDEKVVGIVHLHNLLEAGVM